MNVNMKCTITIIYNESFTQIPNLSFNMSFWCICPYIFVLAQDVIVSDCKYRTIGSIVICSNMEKAITVKK